jgi:hypothetical protein
MEAALDSKPVEREATGHKHEFWHIVCPCMQGRLAGKKAVCGIPIQSDWDVAIRGQKSPMEVCIICAGIRDEDPACPACGKRFSEYFKPKEKA